jgi:two-component system sensor histidine kinase FlrB
VGPNLLSSPDLLADAFSDFIGAASQLEASYRDLQCEVSRLAGELAERNAALALSHAENDRMRAALQQLLDSMPCGALVLDSAGMIVLINPQARELLNLGNADVRSIRDLSALGPIDFERQCMQAEEGSEAEFCVVRGSARRWLAAGSRRVTSAHLCQDVLQESLPIQSIWIIRDITASKQAEYERESARNAMALAGVCTILAHEIRNPLASMELFTNLIAQDRPDSQWVSHLRAGIRMLSATVNNILRMHGGGNPRLSSIDLAATVRSSVEFVTPIAEQAGVALAFEAQDESPMIPGNEESIRQVILNLVCNAIRHSPGGRIVVIVRGCRRDGVRIALVEVVDDGCGIPDEFLSRIFEPGFSVTADTPGLGLAVCQKLMLQHGGRIWVTNRVHHGASFHLEFPAL